MVFEKYICKFQKLLQFVVSEVLQELGSFASYCVCPVKTRVTGLILCLAVSWRFESCDRKEELMNVLVYSNVYLVRCVL